MNDVTDVRKKLEAGQRLSGDDAAKLLRCSDLALLGRLAHDTRLRKKPDATATYIVDRNINYTNICTSKCRFCAFCRDSDAPGAYVLSFDEIAAKIRETKALGGIQILIQGGLHPDLGIEWYEDLFARIKREVPIHIHGLSPSEIIHITQVSGITVDQALDRLRNAGLDTIPGGGAEILDDEIRNRVSPRKCSTDDWLGVMEKAHGLGIRTTATMMFGHLDGIVHRVRHLDRLRTLQDRTGGFTAFIPWTFQPGNTDIDTPSPGGFEYLRTLAVSRLFLDNFDHIQASWVTQGAKIAELALRFGADDLGSTMIEENVVRSAGCSFRLTIPEIERIAESAGFAPQRRNCLYEPV